MKHLKNMLAVFILLTLVSFKKDSSKVLPSTGTYGVCDCGTQDKANVIVELKLESDNTFSYIDNTVADKKLNIKGRWSMKGDKIILQDYGDDVRIHNAWHVAGNSKCIKSRKGMEWRRLCLVGDCN